MVVTSYQFTYESRALAVADGYTVMVTEVMKMRPKENRSFIDRTLEDLKNVPHCLVVNMQDRTFAVFRKPPEKLP